MNREEFNQLDIKGQVDYFNNELKQDNNNFNAICKKIGISKNTILNRFKKEGLLPARQGQKIIAFYDYPIEQNCSVEMKNKKKASDPKDINSILKRIELLEQKVEEYNAKLRCTKEYLNGELRSDKNFINSYENTTTKTFKIDVDVCKELENIFDKYKMYKKQDIVSSLLKYALDNIE